MRLHIVGEFAHVGTGIAILQERDLQVARASAPERRGTPLPPCALSMSDHGRSVESHGQEDDPLGGELLSSIRPAIKGVVVFLHYRNAAHLEIIRPSHLFLFM